MFLRRSEPVLLTEERIGGLCPSLNRPVVDLEGLPVGPARSAILLWHDEQGGCGLLVTVRSEDSGAVSLFEFQGELSSQPHQALDVGLTFAEGMGFLFDEDLLLSSDPGRHRRALEIWCQLTGDELPAAVTRPPAPSSGGDDLMLDDLVDAIEDELAEDTLLDPVRAEEPPAAPAPARGAVLSKFRRPVSEAGAAPLDPNATSGAQLARIQIRKRRRTAADAPETPPLLARLLARF